MPETTTTKENSRQTRLNDLLNTTQKKTYFVAAVTVLFVIVMVLVGILPSYSAFTAQAEQNSLRQEAIDKLETKQTTIENLIKEETAKKTLVDTFNSIFPDSYDQVSMLSDVEKLATENNVVLLSTSVVKIINTNDIIRKFVVTKQVQAQTASLVLEGDRDNLTNFLGNIESNIRIFDVINAVISRKSGKELEQSIPGREFKLNVQFNYFYYVQNIK